MYEDAKPWSGGPICEQISIKEFNSQTGHFTRQQILELKKSKAYKDYMESHGRALVDNNWQTGDDGEKVSVENMESAIE